MLPEISTKNFYRFPASLKVHRFSHYDGPIYFPKALMWKMSQVFQALSYLHIN